MFPVIGMDFQQGVAQQSQVADELGVAASRPIFKPDRIFAPVVAVFNPAPVAPDEFVPPGGGSTAGIQAADVIADAFGRLVFHSPSAPYRQNTPGIRKGTLHGIGAQHGDRPLLDPSVSFFGEAILRLDPGELLLDLLAEGFLVLFDLLEVLPAFFHDDPGRFALVVQRIGGDGFSVQCGQTFNQSLCRFELAVFSVAFFFEQCAIASGAPVSWSASVSTPTVSPINFPSMAKAPGSAPACC